MSEIFEFFRRTGSHLMPGSVFPFGKIRDAVMAQDYRHVNGKIVVLNTEAFWDQIYFVTGRVIIFYWINLADQS